MRIAIMSTFDVIGGAAKAAYRLHKGLRLLGHDSVMLVKLKHSNDVTVSQARSTTKADFAEEHIAAMIQKRWINQNRTPVSNTMFSLPYSGYDLSRSDFVKNSDVLNVHWVARYQSVESLEPLFESRMPVVWTLHDQWGFTGGCHYSAGCEKYQVDCRDCPQLQDNRFQVPYFVLKNKMHHFPKTLTVVTPSRWLAECARKSKVFGNCRIEVIPNSLETDVFKPTIKEYAKEALSIPSDVITLLFGASELKEKRKGFHLLLQSMEYCLLNPLVRELAGQGRIKILTFGEPHPELKTLGVDLVNLGEIASDDELAGIYSASDMFILPSLEDNLPNTILEAMSCGTPVVSFQVGGIPDLVEAGKTGYLAPPGDFKEMGNLIMRLMLNSGLRETMSRQCRSVAEIAFNLSTQANRYIDLFGNVLRTPLTNGEKPDPVMIKTSGHPKQHSEGVTSIPPIDPNLLSLYRQSYIDLIHEQHEEIERLSSEITGNRTEIEALKDTLKNRDNLVDWLKADIELRDSYIESFKLLVQERDTWIKELKAYIENADRLVQERDGWVAWLKGEIEKRDLEIRERTDQLNMIVNGRAYKTGKVVLLPMTSLLKVFKKPNPC
jgi:glycosyltransferase involved in cell wall biosynthesis